MNPIVTVIANPVNVALSAPAISVQLSSAGPQGATGPSGSGSGGSETWGAIIGTLSAQTDLQTALNAKVSTSTTVNGHALSANVTVTASDVGAPSGSGNCSGTNTGDQTSVSGNAGTATALQTPRSINGVNFDGSANITVAAAAGTLTGSTLASGVTASSLTSLGTLASLLTTNTGIYQSGGALEEVVFSNGSSGTSKSINLDNGNLQSVTITGAVTLGLTPPTHPGKMTLIVTQDGTGHVYSVGGSIKWAGGSAPGYSTAASKIDIISIVYDGTNFYGMGGIAFA